MKAQLVKRQDRFDLYNESDGSKIASTLPNPMGKLSLKNCEAIANGYDLDELAVLSTKDASTIVGNQKMAQGFIKGFQKALEILGDKKFSEEDMIEFAKWTFLEVGSNTGKDRTNEQLLLEWKSLQHVEWDVEIEMEPYVVGGNEDFVGDGETHIIETKLRPQLDVDGCLILKRK